MLAHTKTSALIFLTVFYYGCQSRKNKNVKKKEQKMKRAKQKKKILRLDPITLFHTLFACYKESLEQYTQLSNQQIADKIFSFICKIETQKQIDSLFFISNPLYIGNYLYIVSHKSETYITETLEAAVILAKKTHDIQTVIQLKQSGIDV